MKKTRVLHIAQSNCGVAEYLKLFFKYSDRTNFDLDLICSNDYIAEENYFNSINYKLINLDMRREISPLSDIKAVYNIRKCIKEIRPDVIHLHSSKAGALGRIAALFMGIPIVYNPHGWSFDMDVDNKKKTIYKLIERLLAKITDKIITISDYERDIAIKYNICNENRIQTIYNGIEISKYNQDNNVIKIKDELNIPKNSFVIGMVARISKQKSPETFVEIAKILSGKIDNCYFIIVGDGELRDEIIELIKEKELTDIIKITGWTNEVNKYISTFDIGVLTSKWEGFGLVLTEYMASRKPVVASRVGGILSVIKNGYSGFLVNKDSVEEFCDKILLLKDNNVLRNEIIQNAYKEVVEKFNIERVVSEHETIYYNLIDKNKMK